VPVGAPEYPPILARIHDPPFLLWVKGNLAVLPGPAVAVVGSRSATEYGLEVARRLGNDLAASGVVVVSGLARGIDAAAHRGALDAGGPTVAVLGSGVDVIYPPEHRRLAGEVETGGAIASELAPGTGPRRSQFPARNRLISGLSLAVVVIEAPERSGSLITARFALDQGRDVLAVPGSVLTGTHRGSHALLRDGAKLVESVDDILEEIGVPAAPPRGTAPEADPPVSWPADGSLVRLMRPGEAYDPDTLAERSGLDAGAVLRRLTELELAGFVRRAESGRFVRSGRKW
jgi:DNA processing protein